MRPKNDDSAGRMEDPDGAAYRRVLEALRELRPDDPDVALTMRHTPIRVLNNRTLEEVVRAGDADKALRYLQSISAGQNG